MGTSKDMNSWLFWGFVALHANRPLPVHTQNGKAKARGEVGKTSPKETTSDDFE